MAHHAEHGASCPHHHGLHRAAEPTASGNEQRRLFLALGITVAILAVEVVGGLVSMSLALLSDAGHMATDAAALFLAAIACRLAARPPDTRRTYGFRRIEVLSGLFNGVLLLLVAGSVFWEAVGRFFSPVPVRTGLMLGVAVVGLVGNLASAFLLHGFSSLNVRGAYLHVLTDTLSSGAVIMAAVIMSFSNRAWFLDPLLGGLIGLAVLSGAVRLVRDAIHILLEGTPAHIDIETLKREMLGLEGVVGVHDLHVWTLGSGMHALSAHVVVRGTDLLVAGANDAILGRVKTFLRTRHGITHTTLQVESEEYVHAEDVH